MIRIGQDALGLWAWMIIDVTGYAVESGDQRYSRESALKAAAEAWMAHKRRGTPGLPSAPQISFADEA